MSFYGLDCLEYDRDPKLRRAWPDLNAHLFMKLITALALLEDGLNNEGTKTQS
jgi:hypothetical protein